MIETNNTSTLSNSLAEKVYQDISEQNLEEGQLFMTGDEIAQKYKVSRGIVREAISQLRAWGVLESRQGKGLLVGRSDPVHLLERSLPFFSRGANDVAMLGQLRCVLEIGAVDLAVRNATKKQIDCMGELVERFRQAVAKPNVETAELDPIELAFHSLLLEMTNNSFIAGMHRVIWEYFHKVAECFPKHSRPSTQSIQEQYWQHKSIYEGFVRRDIEITRMQVRLHLLPILQMPLANPGSTSA